MAANKYDRFGFDKYGFNKDGFDRMGYNREGFDRFGFDRNGYNRRGIHKITGLDKDGYDVFGYDENGYNREGFDRKGYDRAGYDREGYDFEGYDREGYSEDGFDRDGYDRDGFAEDGYNWDGYDRDGYDRHGYDEDGFDRQGYNGWGYNREGYDRDGFDRNGMDRDGYDKEGFNKYGIDRDGFNRDGYDEYGYDREGYNRLGYDRKGFDREGYDENGYDKDGYDARGFNQEGYDRDNFDIFGFNEDGLNKNGYDLYGVSKNGYNILGYDSDGFDENGLSIDGFTKDSFDEDGFHIYSGFNIKGFDRQGFNINGIDADGYDREGYHYLTGLDRNGFDRDGFSAYGLDKNGYNRKGFNAEGFDKDGYDADGFNKEGYDHKGYNRAGYDRRGYNVNGYNAEGMLDPTIQKGLEIVEDNDPQEEKLEAQYHAKCEYKINTQFRKQVEEEERRDLTPISRRYIDRWGFVQYDVRYPDEAAIRARINNRVDAVLQNPYFCHINYAGNPELYIGKQAVHGWITDWADSRSSYYYQYQMYIGNEEVGLNYVRDIFIKRRKYEGYKDLYNKFKIKKGHADVADSHLSQIIQANQSNKKIHDIIESIQQNQYTIITSDKDAHCVVLGCAGSGKTMILMHKIRYMKYNYSDLKMDQIFVISPTDILGRESRELSALLQVDQVRQFTTSSLYENLCIELLNKLDIYFEPVHVNNRGIDRESCYKLTSISSLKRDVQKKLSSISSGGEFFEREINNIKALMSQHISSSGLRKKTVENGYKLYTDSLEEIKQAGKKDIVRLITQLSSACRHKAEIEDIKDFVEFIYDAGLFPDREQEKKTRIQKLTNMFAHTREAVHSMDYGEFLRTRYLKELHIETYAQLIQIMQLFLKEKMELGEIRNLLFELSTVSAQEAREYIQYTEKTVERMERFERKRDVLQILIDNDMVNDRIMENRNLRYETAFDKLTKLFDNTEDCLVQKGYTPFTFFSEYNKLANRKKKLEEQRRHPGKNSYLFYTILSVLEIEASYKTDIVIDQTHAFQMIYILCGYSGPIDKGKKYVFIDEFQNFAPSEIELITKLYPAAVVNLFGDIDQCINNKGIHKVSDIPSAYMKSKPYTIKENYRNARQITQYINNAFGMNMLAVGLDGVQKTVGQMPKLLIHEDDRVAIIVADNNSYYHYSWKYKEKTNYYTENQEVKRGQYNVIPVSAVKGLEFEIAIVIEKGMTKNELYVAYSRAISELYVISNKHEVFHMIY